MDTLSLLHHNKCDVASPLFWMEESLKMFGLNLHIEICLCMYIFKCCFSSASLRKKKSSFDLLFTFFGCLEKSRAIIKISLWKITVIPETGFSGFNLVGVFSA